MANSIHPSEVFIGDVRLGDGNYIGPYAYFHGPLTVGDGNYFGGHCVIGTPAEDLAHVGLAELTKPRPFGVTIGGKNVIREMTTIHGGVVRDTAIGDGCWILSQTHIDHDCVIGDGTMLAPGVRLAGTVTIGPQAQLGMGVAVHQNTRIGGFTMIGMNAAVTCDVPPCSLSRGVPAKIASVNRRKLERLGIEESMIGELEMFLTKAGPRPTRLPPALIAVFKAYDASESRRWGE